MSPEPARSWADGRACRRGIDLGLSRAHLLQRLERLLGLGLLDHAENRVQDDDGQDDGGIGPLGLALDEAGDDRDGGCDEQHDDHGVGHLLEEALPHGSLLFFLELVGTHAGETRGGLSCRQSRLGVRGLRIEHVFDRSQVLLFHRQIPSGVSPLEMRCTAPHSNSLTPDYNSHLGARACHDGISYPTRRGVFPVLANFFRIIHDGSSCQRFTASGANLATSGTSRPLTPFAAAGNGPRSKPFVNALISARGNAVETGRSETDTPQRGAASLSWLYVNAHPRCGRPYGAHACADSRRTPFEFAL